MDASAAVNADECNVKKYKESEKEILSESGYLLYI